MRQTVENYTNNLGTNRTITLNDFSASDPIVLERLFLIVNATKNTILYNFADSGLGVASLSSGNIITLGSATAGASANSDALTIIYDVRPTDPIYEPVRVDTAVDPSVNIAYDLTSDASHYYIGTAARGTAESASGWTVKRITFSAGNPTFVDYSTGIWNNRASLTYS